MWIVFLKSLNSHKYFLSYFLSNSYFQRDLKKWSLEITYLSLGCKFITTPDLSLGCMFTLTPDLSVGCMFITTPDLSVGCMFITTPEGLVSLNPDSSSTPNQRWSLNKNKKVKV